MPDEKPKKFLPSNWKAIVGLYGGLPVLGFAISTMWHLVMGYGAEITKLQADVKILQDTNAQWATLAEVHKRQQEMEIPIGVVMWLLEHGKIKETEKPTDIAIKIPRLEPINVEDFRRLQEERFRPPVAAAQMKR